MLESSPPPHRRARRLRRFRRFLPVVRPRVGRRLPRELRADRVSELASALPLGVEDPGFEVLLRRIDSAPLLGGNQVVPFFSGDEAFAAMRHAVANAQREILLESYIFRDDGAGRRLFGELALAAGRGVSVRVLTDAVGSFSTAASFWRHMESRGIRVRIFHPLVTHIGYQPFRDHRKILVVDRCIGFTGGMNIGEEYGSFKVGRRAARKAGPRTPGQPMSATWRDSNVQVTGPAAWEMATVFTEGWLRAGGRPLDLVPLPAAEADAPGARILVLDARYRRGHEEAAAALTAIVAAARRAVWITNAYFAPGHRAIEVLGDAARRGVDVRLLLPGKTDFALVRHAGHGYFAQLLARGVRIFEYGASVLHAKTLVADDVVSVVGSTNLDFRSFVFNAECNLVIYDRETAGACAHAFLADLERSTEIVAADWDRRSLPHRAGDRLARLLSPIL